MSIPAAYSHIASNLGAPPFLPLKRDHVGDAPLVNLTGGVPADDILPYESYQKAIGRVLEDSDTAFPAVSYVSPFGIQRLREQVAHWREVPVENVLITNGAMNGIFLAAQTLIDPGDTVLVETPTFPYALNIFRRAGARLESIALRAGGIDLNELEQRLREGRRYKLFYTIPDFQNPAGTLTSAEHKSRLLALADRYGFAVIADNPYRELWFDHEPDGFPDDYRHAERYSPLYEIGTFSKTLGPGWRVGWTVASSDAVRRMGAIRACVDGNSTALGQYAISCLLQEPQWFERLLEAERALYRGRARALASALRAGFGDAVAFDEPLGGFFLWLGLPQGIRIDDPHVQDALAQQNVLVTRGDSFAPEQPGRDPAHRDYADHVRIGFSALPERDLREGADRLAAALIGLA